MKIMRVLDNKEDFIMKLKDTGLSVQDIKDKVNKYMIETYERFDFLAETAEGMYMRMVLHILIFMQVSP